MVVALLYSLPYHKPAGALLLSRAVSLPFLVTMLHVSRSTDCNRPHLHCIWVLGCVMAATEHGLL